MSHRQLRSRLFRAVIAALVIGFAPVSQAEMTPDQWRDDLRVLATQLPKRHKNLFNRLSRADFESQVRRLHEEIPGLSEIHIRAAFMRLVASVGNSHMSVNAFGGTPVFPIAFRAFPEGFFVTHAGGDVPHALGARLLAVNGTPVDDVRRRLLPYIARENRVAELVFVPVLLPVAAPLVAEAVIPSLEEATYTLEVDGRQFDARLRPGPQALVAGRMPRAYLEHDQKKLNYWFEEFPAARTIYLQYNACANMKQQSFKDFTREVVRTARERNAERLVVDLRFNLGGNDSVVRPLLDAVKSERRLRVYALVGRLTFSSGAKAALDLRRAGATLVGEALGQRPNAYGEGRQFQLPNSRLTVSYATRFWRYIPTADPEVIEPDVSIATTAADFFAGTDAALNYALLR